MCCLADVYCDVEVVGICQFFLKSIWDLHFVCRRHFSREAASKSNEKVCVTQVEEEAGGDLTRDPPILPGEGELCFSIEKTLVFLLLFLGSVSTSEMESDAMAQSTPKKTERPAFQSSLTILLNSPETLPTHQNETKH